MKYGQKCSELTNKFQPQLNTDSHSKDQRNHQVRHRREINNYCFTICQLIRKLQAQNKTTVKFDIRES